MPRIKLIKNAELKIPEAQSRIKSKSGRNRLPKVVQAWVVEFKRTRQTKSLVAFDSLFKDALSQSGQSD